MEILKTLKPLKVSGELLRPGEMFKAQEGEWLIDLGYVRHLTKDEAMEILDEYVRYAKMIFKDREQTIPTEKVKHVQGILF